MDFTITGRTAIYTISHSVGIARTTSTMDNQFYVHLFSNGNEKYFPENTSSHFTSLLPEILHLTGRWYVGLAEIEYTHQLKGKERPLHLCGLYNGKHKSRRSQIHVSYGSERKKNAREICTSTLYSSKQTRNRQNRY